MGSVLVQLGRWVEAEAVLDRYEDSRPYPELTVYGLVNRLLDATRLRLATGRFERAAADLERVEKEIASIDPSPGYASWITFLRASLERCVGDHAGAQRRLERSIRLYSDSEDAAPLLWLAAVLARERGDFSPAADLLAQAWSSIAGWDVRYLDLILECLLERATQVCETRPAESVRLIGLVREHQEPFVFLDGVDYDTEAMLADLRRRLGEDEVQDILDGTVGQPLPDEPVFESLVE